MGLEPGATGWKAQTNPLSYKYSLLVCVCGCVCVRERERERERSEKIVKLVLQTLLQLPPKAQS